MMGKLAILLLAYFVSFAESFLIGIDFGTEYFKINILRPAKPFTMVENVQSKTKTNTAIGFKDNERLFGYDAIQKKARFPNQIFTYMHSFLGKSLTDVDVKKFMEDFFISYDVEERTNSSSIYFKVNYNGEARSFRTEEIFGMLFRYAKFLSDKFANSEIRDCVVTIPAFFGYKEKAALESACEMTGLNLLGVVHENVAAAVHYLLDKKLNTTQNVIFYNMGSSYTQVSLVNFYYELESFNDRKIEHKKIKVLAEAWDKNLGGRNFDYNIAKHLAAEFDNLPSRKGLPQVSKNPKIIEKILPNAAKYKELLSAGKVALVNLLGLDAGQNLDTKLSREEFDRINSNEINRAYAPIESVLRTANVTLDQIEWVEILGGSVRIPAVQDSLKSKVGSKFGAHMNGDDSMSFGAAFLAANYSSNFKLQGSFELYHGNSYELNIKLKHIENPNYEYCADNFTDLAENCIRKLNKAAPLYKIRHGVDISKTVSMRHDGNFEVLVYQKFPGEEETLIMKFRVLDIQESLFALIQDKITTKPKINLKFKLNKRGILTLGADISYEQILFFNINRGPTGGLEFIYTANKTEPISIEEIDAEIEKAPTEESKKKMRLLVGDVGKQRTHENKKDLTVETVHVGFVPMTKEEIAESKKVLDQLDQIEEDRVKIIDRKNALESLIYEKDEWLNSETATKYLTPDELSKARKTVNDIKKWFEEDSFNSNITTVDQKHRDLLLPFRGFEGRIKKHVKKDVEVEAFDGKLNKTYHKAKKVAETNPWTDDYFNSNFTIEYLEVQTWFNEKVREQDKAPLHEDPIFTGEMIQERILTLKRHVRHMRKIEKPKDFEDQRRTGDL